MSPTYSRAAREQRQSAASSDRPAKGRAQLAPARDSGAARSAGGENTLRLAHINIRSVRPQRKQNAVTTLLQHRKPDLLYLSETYLSKTDKDPSFPGYQMDRLDRRSRGGGVCVISRQEYSVQKLSVSTNDRPSTESSLECLWLLVTLCNANFFYRCSL